MTCARAGEGTGKYTCTHAGWHAPLTPDTKLNVVQQNNSWLASFASGNPSSRNIYKVQNIWESLKFSDDINDSLKEEETVETFWTCELKTRNLSYFPPWVLPPLGCGVGVGTLFMKQYKLIYYGFIVEHVSFICWSWHVSMNIMLNFHMATFVTGPLQALSQVDFAAQPIELSFCGSMANSASLKCQSCHGAGKASRPCSMKRLKGPLLFMASAMMS